MLQYVTKVEMNYQFVIDLTILHWHSVKSKKSFNKFQEKICLKVYIMLLINLNQYIY